MIAWPPLANQRVRWTDTVLTADGAIRRVTVGRFSHTNGRGEATVCSECGGGSWGVAFDRLEPALEIGDGTLGRVTLGPIENFNGVARRTIRVDFTPRELALLAGAPAHADVDIRTVVWTEPCT